MLYNNVNDQLMTSNLNKVRLGCAPQVDVIKDLPRKPKYSVDSFFVIGRVESGNHKLNYLVHIMALHMPIPIPKIAKKWQVCFSIMDENTGYYKSGDHIYDDNEVKVDTTNFSIKAPNCEMSGTWDNMKIWLKEPDFEINTTTTAIHYPLFTRGASVFDLFGMVIHQFSIPYMKTKGYLTVNSETYQLDGNNAVSWFDRQWQSQNFKITTEWSWMAIYLDNGDIISILDSIGDTDTPKFMTVMKPDGTLINKTDEAPFSECETRHWKSEKSGNTYGTKWDLNLPSFNSKLHIVPVIENQEIISSMKKLSKYEGSANVTGIYEGEKITGRATVELIKI